MGACAFTTEKWSDLDTHAKYRMQSGKAVNPRFGRRIVVKLEGVDGHIYLPEHFKALADEEIGRRHYRTGKVPTKSNLTSYRA